MQENKGGEGRRMNDHRLDHSEFAGEPRSELHTEIQQLSTYTHSFQGVQGTT